MEFRTDKRRYLLKLAYQIMKNKISSSLSEFNEELHEDRLIGIYRHNVCLGVVSISSDNYIHISVIPKQRGYWAGRWVFKLLAAESKERPLYTMVYKNQVPFAQRLGFELLAETGKISIMQYVG